MSEHLEIRALLPQRHPLLLVDRVLDVEAGRFIRTVKAVTGSEPCYADLPEDACRWRWRYPAGLLIESFGQSAALLWLRGEQPDLDDGRTLMFVAATGFRFDGPVYPGDVVRHEVRLDSVIADTAFASGESWVGDRRVATVTTLVATRRPVQPPHPQTPELARAAA
ncbi:beta-hydroxyacyl-ACP dehydratase [Actinoplanes sp. NPDC051861]|uniref:3-hydroxyacyl-ACP dehydratase FabZ family protein n=1 Tax=Actinoplanes sp. NPDC051861 TaxID=3155170 RepID=UPI003416684E